MDSSLAEIRAFLIARGKPADALKRPGAAESAAALAREAIAEAEAVAAEQGIDADREAIIEMAAMSSGGVISRR